MELNPASELRTPATSDPIPDLAENIIGVSQYLSLSYWIGQAADMVCGQNPWLWIGEQVGGDWEAVQKAGVALSNLAEFNIEASRSIQKEMENVSHDWQGNAANDANEYFTSLASSIRDQEQTLRELSKQFKEMAVGMYETANAIKGLLETLFDLLIAMGIELAAAAASSYTVIGPVLSGAAFAATLTKAMGIWGQVLQAHTWAWNLCQATVGLTAGYAPALRGIDTPSLPSGSYNHPGV